MLKERCMNNDIGLVKKKDIYFSNTPCIFCVYIDSSLDTYKCVYNAYNNLKYLSTNYKMPDTVLVQLPF